MINYIYSFHSSLPPTMPIIVQICVEGNTGSTGRIAESIGSFLIQKGWDSYIAHGRFPRQSKSRLIRIGSDWGVFLHVLLTRFLGRHGFGSKRATKALINKISEIKPDIIHLHHLHGYYINITILFNYLSKAGIPVIWTFHDCWSFTGHCAYFEVARCNKWRTECNNCPQLSEYPRSYIDRSRQNYHIKKKLFNSVQDLTIVSVSKWLDLKVGESFMSKAKRRVIYNGIDLNIFNPVPINRNIRKKNGVGKQVLLLGVASPWSERKGFNDFLNLSKLLDKGYILVLVGLSKVQIRGLPDNIIGLEKTENQNELKDLYIAADVFLNLSREETFGLTTAEALACGTPVIVYDSSACPELVVPGTGYVVPENNLYELKLRIDEIASNGKYKYSEACIAHAAASFNISLKNDEYYNLYKELII